MVGQVLGAVDSLPGIFTELVVSYLLLRRLLGVKTEADKKGAKVRVKQEHKVLRNENYSLLLLLYNKNFYLI